MKYHQYIILTARLKRDNSIITASHKAREQTFKDSNDACNKESLQQLLPVSKLTQQH